MRDLLFTEKHRASQIGETNRLRNSAPLAPTGRGVGGEGMGCLGSPDLGKPNGSGKTCVPTHLSAAYAAPVRPGTRFTEACPGNRFTEARPGNDCTGACEGNGFTGACQRT